MFLWKSWCVNMIHFLALFTTFEKFDKIRFPSLWECVFHTEKILAGERCVGILKSD